ncbi:glycoside hydrolase family 95 protein [Fundicoccus culcitae]|uniref:Glycoside hydrolase family 95 protein n=1 Tax=Fundicoccus culcitae TaxID=2969821 RepID=A0ABY5P9H8_9LACT|nr:glycoside hydrolase family 95 protein [Fundicoccus culcitae]UUX35251.1 glycoside hydrolase family 95 protein [Fundicoccus culcitae]
MKIYFNQPQTDWEDSLVFGNGSLGGMTKGSLEVETINLNDDRFWSGTKERPTQTYTKAYLPEIRQAILDKAYKKAESLIEQHMLGYYTESYLVLGHLSYIQDIDTQTITDYKHQLDLNQALIKTNFSQKQNKYHRTYFASYPDQAMYLEFRQTHPFHVAKLIFETPFKHKIEVKNQQLHIQVEAPTHVVPSYIQTDTPIVYEGETEKYHYVLELLHIDGDYSIDEAGFQLNNFTTAQFVFRRNEEKAVPSYYQALENHLADYQKLFKRIELNWGPEIDLPIDQRVERLRNGEKDDDLITLYYQFGRYLMIASSRPGSLAANLQGIWNWQIRPPWSSNYTTNINLQMNYWGADLVELSECYEPYIDLVKQLTESGKQTAKELYGINGSVIHHNADKWGNTSPVGRQYGASVGDEGATTWAYWPMAGLWMSADLFRHYEFTQDKDYLKETVFPILRENILFIKDFLVEVDGVYQTIPSTSPENQYFDEDSNRVSISKSTTMDVTLINELIDNYQKTIQLLGIEDVDELKLLKEVLVIKEKLAPIPIDKNGKLLEYQEAYREVEPGHRHFSHLYGIFPSNYLDESYFPAALKAIEARMSAGGGHTGWSNAWLINLYVKLGEYDKAYQQIIQAITETSSKSLLSLHPPFQIDGNFGVMTGIANFMNKQI